MAIEITVPKLGLTMEEATLVAWKFKAGEVVKKEQVVLVLETDKVTFEMPSPGEGLLHPLAAAGSRIEVSQVVGYLAADRAELEQLAARHPAAQTGAPAPAAAAPGGRVKASPVARVMAKAHGIDLARLAGSGPGGRIVRADLLAAIEKGPGAPAPPAPAAATVELLSAAQEIPIAGVRKVIFKNMHLSLATQAQLTLHTEAAADALIRLRRRMNAAGGAKVSFNAILVKVIASALKQHPLVNAAVEGDRIKVWRQVHVGVAMDLGKGLIVPKVRHADTRSIREISAEIDRLVEAAKAGRLSLDDLTVGTFTLTNLGAWDIDDFTPIVNHPESAILGVGRIVEKPVARNGQVLIEPRMALSLSFDHRIIDGAPGAAFLKTIKDMIEEPALML
ncbi:MAG: 2-oxo acid dehydrogenase subunit E2 [Desulfobacterales bacterium]|jgi:pyruvate/2-oxoglutarate dehydrogenase complex dihydrolipoamide acyltransferase (E2) component|nr:2-oxo acid dehydrogenase subunit E2 [Desulfobacterales bacterium]